HRAVERNARLAPARDLFGMALGVGGREATAYIARAGDETGADRARAGREPKRFDAADRVLDPVGWYAGDEQVLPDGEADVAVAERARDAGEPTHLVRAESADRQHDADPVEPLLRLWVHADMGRAIEGRARRDRFSRNASELAAELVLGKRHDL